MRFSLSTAHSTINYLKLYTCVLCACGEELHTPLGITCIRTMCPLLQLMQIAINPRRLRHEKETTSAADKDIENYTCLFLWFLLRSRHTISWKIVWMEVVTD
jgi:hypothetical protein